MPVSYQLINCCTGARRVLVVDVGVRLFLRHPPAFDVCMHDALHLLGQQTVWSVSMCAALPCLVAVVGMQTALRLFLLLGIVPQSIPHLRFHAARSQGKPVDVRLPGAQRPAAASAKRVGSSSGASSIQHGESRLHQTSHTMCSLEHASSWLQMLQQSGLRWCMTVGMQTALHLFLLLGI